MSKKAYAIKAQDRINEADDLLEDDIVVDHVDGYEFDPNESYHQETFSERWSELRNDDYRAYRRRWDEVPRNKQMIDFPIHLDIETTNICNLLCPMCPRTIAIANDSFSQLEYMSRENYDHIIDQAVQHGAQSIKLNYLGEPLLHKEIVHQISYAKKQGIVDTMLNTNASVLTKELGQEMLEAGLDNLFVSFDAINPDDYEKQRPGTSLGKVIDNVYNFIKLRNEIRPSCQVRLSMVMYKNAKWKAQFEGLKAMWKGLADAVGYGFYVEREQTEQQTFPEVKGFYCAQPFQRMFLKINGNVTICCVDDKDETVVGNWREQSLYDIWNGTKYSQFRQQHAEGKYYDIEMCRKCYLPVSQ